MIDANEKYYYKDLLSSEARAKIYALLADLYKRLPGHTTNSFLTAVLEATRCFLELEACELFSSKAPDKASGSEPA